MTAFTALLQPAANVQGLLGTFADTRHDTMNYTCLRAGAEGTVREETAQAMGRDAPSDDGTIVPEWKCREPLKPGGASTIHTEATVHYPNLNGNLAVDTLSHQALLVTCSWRSESMQTKMFRLRNCFEQIVPIIQDQPGTNAAWQAVDGASTRVFGHDGLQHVG
jgi:hypothetical protein